MADGVNFVGTLDNEDIKRKAAEAGKAFERMGASAQEEGKKIDEAFKLMAKTAASFTAGFFSVRAVADFTKQIINVRSEIQSLEVSFKTLLGDEEKAVKLMADIRKFAANTPMQMNDLAAGAQTLLAFNIEAERVMPILQALGDISMGDSQKFQSLTLAFSQMSSTGRLLGQDLGQMINAGFNPLAQISEKTGKSIGELKQEMAAGKISVDMVTEAFMDATSEGGKFYNMLEQQSKGIQGSLSNVQGALQDMMNELGEKLQEPVTDTLHGLQSLIQNYEKVGKVLATLVATYGSYKAAVIAVTAVEAIRTQVANGYTIAMQLQYRWMLLVEKLQKSMLLKNPYVLVTTAVLSLASAFFILRKRTDEAKIAQESLNRETSKSFERSEELKNKVDEYKSILDDETASELAHYHALQQLKALLPNYLKDVNTYNEYLQRRKELLDGMPQAEDEQENRTLQEKISLLERYEELKKAGQFSGRENYQQFDERIRQDFGSYEEYQKQFNEVKKMVQEFYDSVEDENKGTLDQYVKSTIAADKEILEKRKRDQKAAAESAIPIRQKIELKKEEIDKIQQQVNDLKKKIENNPAKFYVDSEQLTELIGKLGILKSELGSLEQQQALAPVKDLKAITKAIDVANAALTKAQNDAKKYGLDATTSKAIADAEASLESAKKDYKTITGKDYDQVVKEGKDRLKAQKDVNKAFENEAREFAEWQTKQAKQAVFERTQADIDAREESLEKTLMQINLDYEKQRFAIEENEKDMVERVRRYREAEWASLNPSKKKEDNPYSVVGSVTVEDLGEDQKKQIEQQYRIAEEVRVKAVTDANKNVLDEVRSYEEQRLKIQETFARKREEIVKAGGSQAHIDENKRQEDEALKSLDEEIASRSDRYQSWLTTINGMTVKGLENMLDTTKRVLDGMEKMPGVNENTLAILRAQINTLEREIKSANLTPEQKDLEVWQKYGSEIGKLGDEISNLGDTIGGVVGKAFNALGGMVGGVVSAIDGIKQYAVVSTQTIEGVSEAAAAAIRTAEQASVVLAIVSALIQALQKFDNIMNESGLGEKLHYGNSKVDEMVAAEKEREKRLNDLTKAYDKLGDAIDKAYGESRARLVQEQAENLRQQIAELEQARREEEAKKNPDEDVLNDYNDQVDQAREKMEGLHDAEMAAIFGSDIQSAIESLADALVNAWSEGSSAAESYKDFARQQTKAMLTEYVKEYIAQMKLAEQLRDRIRSAQSDGTITNEEWNAINAYAEEQGRKVEEALAPIIERIRQLGQEEERRAGTKGIAQASQESVNELNGRFTAIQGHTYGIKQDTSGIADSTFRLLAVSNDILGTVRSIDNTTSSIDTRLADIHNTMVYLRRSMSGIEQNGLKLK